MYQAYKDWDLLWTLHKSTQQDIDHIVGLEGRPIAAMKTDCNTPRPVVLPMLTTTEKNIQLLYLQFQQ